MKAHGGPAAAPGSRVSTLNDASEAAGGCSTGADPVSEEAPTASVPPAGPSVLEGPWTRLHTHSRAESAALPPPALLPVSVTVVACKRLCLTQVCVRARARVSGLEFKGRNGGDARPHLHTLHVGRRRVRVHDQGVR